MAPLDLDKYVEIARQCKYLPENDLKVSRAGGRPACEASPFRLRGARRPALLPRADPGPGAAGGAPRCEATGSDTARRREAGEPDPEYWRGSPRGSRGCAAPALRTPSRSSFAGRLFHSDTLGLPGMEPGRARRAALPGRGPPSRGDRSCRLLQGRGWTEVGSRGAGPCGRDGRESGRLCFTTPLNCVLGVRFLLLTLLWVPFLSR